LAWSRDNGDVELALQIASSLQPLWVTRGRLREGLSWIDAGLADLATSQHEVATAVRARSLADAALLDGWVGVPERREQAGEALAIARQLDDPKLLVRALTACCGTASFDPEEGATYFAEAIDLARSLGDKWRLSQLLGFQAYATMMAGDAIAARAVGEEGRELADAIGDRFASGQCRVWGLAGARAVLGDLPGADDELAELIADADAAGDPLCRFNGLTTHSFVLGWQGKTTAARAAAEAAIESATELGALIEGQGYLTLGAAELAAGDVAAAKEALMQGWNRIADIDFSMMNTRWRAETDLAAGDLTAARSWADQAVSATRGFFRMLALTTRARVAMAEYDAEAAVRDAYDALACAADVKAQLGLPDVLDCLAQLAAQAESYPEAARLVGAAEAVRQHTAEVPYEIHRADYEALLAALRDAMGQSDFDTARAEGGGLSTEEAIAYAQRGRGERKRPSTGWGSLTPTERDVVRLVSEGLSNKDIAAKLFVSPRTVDTHLTHVYTKLDLSSRVQLAQEVTRRRDAGRLG
jgi:DNA-binding CsgD family transcriptional regulator